MRNKQRYCGQLQNHVRQPRIHQHKETCGIASCRAHGRRIKPKLQPSTKVLNCFTLMVCLRTSKFLSIAMLNVFEDNEAAIKMIIKGRSPTMRHVWTTQRVALDWLVDRINLDPKIQIKHIDTKHHLAAILTKEHFTRDEWNNLLRLLTSAISALCCAKNVSLLV